MWFLTIREEIYLGVYLTMIWTFSGMSMSVTGYGVTLFAISSILLAIVMGSTFKQAHYLVMQERSGLVRKYVNNLPPKAKTTYDK